MTPARRCKLKLLMLLRPSLDALRTPANGQIFALKKSLSKTAVQSAFHSASAHASGRVLGRAIREKRAVDGMDFWASFVCFPLTRCPPFLPGTALAEHTYGFLLLVELCVSGEWFVGIFTHAAASLTDWISYRAKPLPRAKFTNAFSGKSTVRKISVRRLTASKHELHAASYEAPDIESSLPMMSASHTAIRTVRFDDAVVGSVGVTVNTSRVQRSGGRCKVGDLAGLVRMVAENTQANKRSAFLSAFAQVVPVGDLPPEVEPTSVLFDWSGILESDAIELYRGAPSGEVSDNQVPKKLLQRVLGAALTSRQPDRVGCSATVRSPRGATRCDLDEILGEVHSQRSPLCSRYRQQRKLSRSSNGFARTTPLALTFTNPEFFFGDGALYQRADFVHEVDAVRRCLQVHAELAHATSEKGVPKRSATNFPAASVFRIVEDSVYANSEWLCCLDLGDEWADYLCIRNNALIFIHCKAGKKTRGASSFHEVVSQGLKNLGRVQGTPTQFEKKLESTRQRKYWSGTKNQSTPNRRGYVGRFSECSFQYPTRPNCI